MQAQFSFNAGFIALFSADFNIPFADSPLNLDVLHTHTHKRGLGSNIRFPKLPFRL